MACWWLLGGLLVAALPLVDVAEVGPCVSFAGPVADLTEQGQGALVVLGGLVMAPRLVSVCASAARSPVWRAACSAWMEMVSASG